MSKGTCAGMRTRVRWQHPWKSWVSLCLLPSAGHAEQAGLKVCRLGSLREWSDPGSVRALSQESGEGRVEATALPTYSISTCACICMQFLIKPSEFEVCIVLSAYAHVTENEC